jgi:hypothetical protein
MKRLACLCAALCLLVGCHRTIELGNFRETSNEKGLGPLVIRERPVVMHFEENDHKFDAMIAAAFDKGESARAYIRTPSRNSMSRPDSPMAGVSVCGLKHCVDDRRAHGLLAADRWIDSRRSPLEHRRRRRGEDQLAKGVKSLPGATKKLRLDAQHFATIAPDGLGNYSIVDSGPIKGNNTVAPFITELRDAVKGAGLLPTWPGNLP